MSYNNQTAKETEKSLQLLSKNYTTFFMKSSGKKKKEKNQLIQLVLPVVYKRWLRPKQLDQNCRHSTARIGIQLVIQTKIFTSVVSWKLRRAESKLSAKKPLRTGIVGDTCRLQSVSIHQLKENRKKTKNSNQNRIWSKSSPSTSWHILLVCYYKCSNKKPTTSQIRIVFIVLNATIVGLIRYSGRSTCYYSRKWDEKYQQQQKRRRRGGKC